MEYRKKQILKQVNIEKKRFGGKSQSVNERIRLAKEKYSRIKRVTINFPKTEELISDLCKIPDDSYKERSSVLKKIIQAMFIEKKTALLLGKYGRKTARAIGEQAFSDELKGTPIPKSFQAFSFRTFDTEGHAIDDIKNKQLTLVYPGLFNDPFDTIYIQSWRHQLQTSTDDSKKELACIMLQYAEFLKVRCFLRAKPQDNDSIPETQNIDDVSLLMWAHYANCHKGFCVQYNFSDEYINSLCNNTGITFRIAEIDYQKNLDLNTDSALENALIKKSYIWSYEYEVRIIMFNPKCPEQTMSINAPEVMAIYLGLRCSSSDKEKLLLALRGKDVPVYQMKIDPNNIDHLIHERIG